MKGERERHSSARKIYIEVAIRNIIFKLAKETFPVLCIQEILLWNA